ncbi:metal binding domain of Ada-domain-containing protein [Boeremia exigua]|uniref:metal binding domain of Ada-domain-containing protein n=1 Tax=Boeremia exigua TaxID=749465 RepID=UPI001E8EADAB|nr:metal binding domain of Ada-domain-containing protein [Boeremia exigua]KAH6638340.1 metal binding domain of Ada-domain-containing protein [Boeremia exigua]
MSYITEAQRWRALATRDPNANGHFFYSVKSTQIYCRPTCPARLARRANISFQKTIAEAEALGFRACKRCRPNVENEDPQDKAVAKAMGFIEEAVRRGDAKQLKLHDLAKKVGLTPRYFHKIFKDKTNTTPREYTNIVAAQHSSSSPSSGSDASPSNLENFDWDTFDISELAKYHFDSNSTLSDDFMVQAAQITAAGFGETSIDEQPIQPWVMGSPDGDNSDTDSTLSNEQLSSLSGWDSTFIDFGQYPSTKPILIDPTFDFDINLAMLLQNDMAGTDFTLDVTPDFDMSAVSSAPAPLS